MKKSITFLLFIMGMMNMQTYAGGDDSHLVSVSQNCQCLNQGPITITLHLKGFTDEFAIQWQYLKKDSTWANINGQTKKTFTTDSIGIYRAAVKEQGNCDQKGKTYYSPDIDVRVCSTMPTTLTSFTGIVKNNSIQLHWMTSFEENTSHIEVQQSTDGDFFSTIHTVPAAGRSNVTLQYAVALPMPTIKEPSMFYRLEMVDIDGAAKFSNVIVISLENASNLSEGIIYPNPVVDKFNLNLNSYTGNLSKTKIRIVDEIGKKIYEQDFTGQSIDASHFIKGLYFCTVTDGSTSIQTKFMK